MNARDQMLMGKKVKVCPNKVNGKEFLGKDLLYPYDTFPRIFKSKDHRIPSLRIWKESLRLNV